MGSRLALETKQAVGVVLDDRDVRLAAERDERLASRRRHRDARRVVEVRHRVDELGALAAKERLLELFDDHAVLVEIDLQEPRLVGAERRERADVRGGLDRDEIARIDEHLADEVQRLLRPRRDDKVLRVGGGPLLGHEHRESLAKERRTLSRSVLQGDVRAFGEHRLDDLDHVLGGEGLDERHPARERDHVGSRGDREQRAYLRRRHADRATRVEIGERVDVELGHGPTMVQPRRSRTRERRSIVTSSGA